MSIDTNIVLFGGRLVADPTTLGGKGARFEVACNRTYELNGEKKKVTTFMPIFCWGKLGDVVLKSCKKGDSVLVEGELEDRRFTGDDGQKRKLVGIKASDVKFVNVKRNDDAATNDDTTYHGEPLNEIPKETSDAIKRLLNG
jgi:single stranded DNA-binding protein